MSEQVLSLRSDAVSWTPTDDGAVIILDLRTSKYLSLNNSGALLWTLLSAGSSAGDLASGLVAEYGVGDDAARADVAAFLTGLRLYDLVAGTS